MKVDTDTSVSIRSSMFLHNALNILSDITLTVDPLSTNTLDIGLPLKCALTQRGLMCLVIFSVGFSSINFWALFPSEESTVITL